MLIDPIIEDLAAPATGKVIWGRKGPTAVGMLPFTPGACKTLWAPSAVNGTCKEGREEDAIGILLLAEVAVS